MLDWLLIYTLVTAMWFFLLLYLYIRHLMKDEPILGRGWVEDLVRKNVLGLLFVSAFWFVLVPAGILWLLLMNFVDFLIDYEKNRRYAKEVDARATLEK